MSSFHVFFSYNIIHPHLLYFTFIHLFSPINLTAPEYVLHGISSCAV